MSMASRISARAARLGFENLVVPLVPCALGAVLAASARPAPIPINLRLVTLVLISDTLFSRAGKKLMQRRAFERTRRGTEGSNFQSRD